MPQICWFHLLKFEESPYMKVNEISLGFRQIMLMKVIFSCSCKSCNYQWICV